MDDKSDKKKKKSRYRCIEVRIHADEKFINLSGPQPNAKSLFLFILVHPNSTTIPGVFRTTIGDLCDSFGWKPKKFRPVFDELIDSGMIKFDQKTGLLWVKNALKYNPPANPNVVISWDLLWEEVPECALKAEIYHSFMSVFKTYHPSFMEAFLETIPTLDLGKPSGKPSGKPCPIQEQEQEQEKEKENKEKEQTLVEHSFDESVFFEDSEPKKLSEEVAQTDLGFVSDSSASLKSGESKTRSPDRSGLIKETEKNESEPRRKTKWHDEATCVADYYRKRNPGKGRAIHPGHPDWRRITALLQQEFSVEDLAQAVDGNLIDDWHVKNRKHSAEYVFRNSTKVEGFIDIARKGNPEQQPTDRNGNVVKSPAYDRQFDPEE